MGGVILLVLIGVGMIVPRFIHVLEKPFAVFSRPGDRRTDQQLRPGHRPRRRLRALRDPVLAAVIVAASSTGRIGAGAVTLALSFAAGTAIPTLAFALAGAPPLSSASHVPAIPTACAHRRGRHRPGVGRRDRHRLLPAVLQRALPDYTSTLPSAPIRRLSRGEGRRSTYVDGATTLADCGALPS